MRWLFLMTLFAACNGDSDTDTDLDTDTEVDTEADTELQGTVMSGVVTDEDGNGVEGVRVNLCRQVCTTATTDATGAYTMPALLAQRYALHIETVGDITLSDPHVPYDLIDAETVQLDAVVSPATAIALDDSRRWRHSGNGLLLDIMQGDLELLFEDDPTEFSAVRAEGDARLPIDLEGEVVAMWYLDPWDATAAEALTDGIPVYIEDDWRDAGSYSLYQANYDEAEWEHIADLTSTRNDDLRRGWLVLDGDAFLHRLDTLVVIRNPAE